MSLAKRFGRVIPAALLLAACAGCSPVKEEEPAAVCCESFGYGAGMVECCSNFAWTRPEECKVPPGMVGGGRRVVGSERCPAH
jgi:hypothetical protein